jgi:DNA-binding MarR family transcriptional regulator
MTNTLQRLEADGLVKIVGDPGDGRAKLVALTAKGKRTRDAAVARLAPALAAVSAHMGSGALNELLAPLARLRAHLDAARDG